MPKKTLYGPLTGARLKTLLHGMILFLGLIFLAIQFYTVLNYSTFINESNASLKLNIVKILTRENLIHNHYAKALEFVEKLARDPLFLKSVIAEDSQEIKRQLEGEHSRKAIKMSGLDIMEIRALSRNYQPLARWLPPENDPISPQENQQASSGAETLKIARRFYKSQDGNPLHMLIFPVGGTEIKGYLKLITSPLTSLDDIEESIFNMMASYDNGVMREQQRRLNIFKILALMTGLLVLLYIASYVLNISMLSRIREISEALAKIVQGKTGVKLPEVRNDELSVLWEQLEKIAAHEEDRNRLSYELVFALKAAENSNMAKSEFLTNMSHELRTPLNAIIGFSEIMTCDYLACDLNDKYREYAQDIRDSGLHLLNIINDILELSKVESGNVILNIEEVDVCDLIGKSVNLVVDPAKKKSITIENRIPGKLPFLYVDERMVRQILLNILSNAVNFNLEGGNIVIDAGQENDGTFCIAVSDNGIGIEKEKIGKIIYPFCQVNESYTSKQGGAGLGLTLVKAFMELHGGNIYMESTWGVGTSVYLIFPGSCLKQDDSPKLQESVFFLARQSN